MPSVQPSGGLWREGSSSSAAAGMAAQQWVPLPQAPQVHRLGACDPLQPMDGKPLLGGLELDDLMRKAL